ncbi:exopolyphosphatase [Paraferrimonas sedimenticola]|uniref:Exopolyphosphatase n=1 Tax=Paraferrimonas sedimenticola TaxID=375674 RepID=A0AA37RXS0_9GAMM|nr:exopolyphosphatase [Paraferrimonas sedimenticola]GLP97444.1 exopolyphosphatase [Paraferrimonas sedimenticola]
MTDAADAKPSPQLAAITLGSNSFNMLLAASADPLPIIVAKHKRKVRLAEGIDASGRLTESVFERGLDCLRWFADELAKHSIQAVKVFATAALRQTQDAERFCQRAETILGHPLEIISGEREAELIFAGMTATTPGAGKRLVIDIGGASTEFIAGLDDQMQSLCSLPLGCVVANRQLQSIALLSEQDFAQLDAWVALQIDGQLHHLEGLHWDSVVGASGIVQTLIEIARHRGVSEHLSGEWLAALASECIGQAPLAPKLDGLLEERRPTFVAGLVILCHLMARLNFDWMQLSGGALREGVLLEAQASLL